MLTRPLFVYLPVILAFTVLGSISGCVGANTGTQQSSTSLIGPLDAVTNTCIRLQIIVHQNNGNANVNYSAFTYNLSSSSATGTYYTDDTCTAVTTTATIGTKSTWVDTFYKDTAAGNPTLTVKYSGSFTISDGTLTMTVGPQITAATGSGSGT